jgi:hypothetical protein
MHQGALKRASKKALLVSLTADITSDKASMTWPPSEYRTVFGV